MIQKIDIPVSVSFNFDSKKQRVYPKWIVWSGRLYPVIKIGLHHKFKKGQTLYHVFSVETKSLFFKLLLNTDNLHWRLQEISDGLPN
jgi:hypothetical protein